jgi:hypothetical protein
LMLPFKAGDSLATAGRAEATPAATAPPSTVRRVRVGLGMGISGEEEVG